MGALLKGLYQGLPDLVGGCIPFQKGAPLGFKSPPQWNLHFCQSIHHVVRSFHTFLANIWCQSEEGEVGTPAQTYQDTAEGRILEPCCRTSWSDSTILFFSPWLQVSEVHGFSSAPFLIELQLVSSTPKAL